MAAKPFLDVSHSVLDKLWADRLDDAGQRRALALAQSDDIPDIIARILAGRLHEEESAQGFLDPKIKTLMPDPSVLMDMDAAAACLAESITKRQKIAIFGDYDVDGATSAAVMARFLAALGVEAEIYIPDRIFEGYGPNAEAIAGIRDRGAALLITVDCGMTSLSALRHAADIGLETVVIDHHQPADALPIAKAVVNPNRHDDLSGLGYLAAVGVTFMAVVAANRALREAGDTALAMADIMALLPLVALGTVCDVVPLVALNRAFVRRGLEIMGQRQLPGLRALSDSARLSGAPTPYHLGFLLGPRINAGGRIGRADLGARLLTVKDTGEAERIAAELERLNRERQEMESVMLEEAMAEADAALGKSGTTPFLLSAHEDWHPGVVGLIASRLKDRFNRPAFAVSKDRAGIGTGSARSVPGVDLGAVVRGAVDAGILKKGGGHKMAAGFTVPAGGMAEFRAYLETALTGLFDPKARQTLMIDGALTASGLNAGLLETVERAGPFGAGNPDPCFVLPHHSVRGAGPAGKDHIRCTLHDGGGGKVSAIAFRAAGTPLGAALLKAERPLHLAGHARIDRWGGGARIQFQLRDAAIPGQASKPV